MTVENREPKTFRDAIQVLVEFAAHADDYVFRGHVNSTHRLMTSLERYWSIRHEEWDKTTERMLERFKYGLIKTGQAVLDNSATLVDQLEYARHHGVPSPLLDFTWSPYIALFFAFNGLHNDSHDQLPGSSVVYALNIAQLSKAWASGKILDHGSPEFSRLCNEFHWWPEVHTLKSLPGNELRFIWSPSQFTRRMQWQLGAFLYCTLHYEARSLTDLEEYLERIKEGQDTSVLPNSPTPVLTKIYIRHAWAKEVFGSLELMNITGATLFSSPDGVAMDIRNAYHYNPKAAYLRQSKSDTNNTDS